MLATEVPASARSLGADDPAVAIVADFANTSKDRHATTLHAAEDAVAVELKKRHVYDVLSRREVQKAAASRAIREPYTPEDYMLLAKDLGATVIVTGELREVNSSSRGSELAVETGLIVRVKEAESDDLLNGAAVRASVALPGGSKTEGELAIDAVSLAATRAVAQIEGYKPITGTIMSSVGNGPIMLNRGMTHGVKPKQEFIVIRDGRRVGRVQARKPSTAYTELNVLDNSGGIQPQDRVVSLFPEPRLDGRGK
jgi:hypothetical protein